MKKITTAILALFVSVNLYAQNVNIPDANFKAYLVANTAINTNGDTEIQESEAASFTGQIGCSNKGITDMTGLEAFTSLTALQCIQNNLGSLDVSQNTDLTLLNVMVTQLDSLDVSQNTALTNLICNNNNLKHLDVGQNSKLQIIRCANNSITSLDLSSNNKLWYIDCQSNDLSLLDIKNIPISQITTFYGQSNTNLSCIEVDNVAEATTALTSIDPGVKFSTNCVIDLVTSIDIQGANGASTITDLGGTLQMEASVSPSNADDATYTWSVVNGTGQATIDSNGLLSALADGDVTVQATANDASEVLGSTTVSISGQTSNTQEFYNSKIQVYPNPFTSQIQITSIERIEKVDVTNLLGETVKISAETSNLIDLSNLSPGVYILQLTTDEATISKKIIKK